MARGGDLPAQRLAADPTGLLNKYALPKVAMVVIAGAAAVGTVLTTVVGAHLGYAHAAARYLLLMGAATAAGGRLWESWILQPATRLVGGPQAGAYAQRQRARFRRLERGAWLAAACGGAALAPAYWRAGAGAPLDEHLALAASGAALLGWAILARWSDARPGAAATGGWVRPGALTAVSLLLWSAAFLQVWYDTPGDWQGLLWRILHLSAFAAWFGGAVWNVAVAVPAAREDLSLPVVIAANAQLERFRAVVRIALPLIVATGLLQVWNAVGITRWAVQGPFGHLVLVKLGLVALLVLIFNTCPMWHACSPIAGMCDLRDLPAGQRPAAGESQLAD